MEHLPVLISEVRTAALQMENGKAPGPDEINIEIIKAGGHELWKALAARFSWYFREMRIPSSRKESKTVLLFKKGNSPNLPAFSHLQAVFKNFD